MNVIQELGKAVQKDRFMSDVVLVVDAMAIQKGTFWDTKLNTFVGRVDCGIAVPEPSDTLATEALVIMAVGITGHWKHPIAYVFQDHCHATVQTQLIKDCISLLHAEGLYVHALVFDGMYTNQSTAGILGCKMQVGDLRTWFPHPQSSNDKVYVIFDACYMLKLMWNLLADFEVISHTVDGVRQLIKWQYIASLSTLQEDLGWRIANKVQRTLNGQNTR